MSIYQSLITRATNVKDPVVLEEIEGIMRLEHSTLDHLDWKRFRKLAIDAHKAYLEFLEEPDEC